MTPACAAVILKSLEISVNKPIGINSDVFTRKAEMVIPISGSHSLEVIFVFIYIIFFPLIKTSEIIVW